jgi:hypothetical protein
MIEYRIDIILQIQHYSDKSMALSQNIPPVCDRIFRTLHSQPTKSLQARLHTSDRDYPAHSP